MRSKRKKIKKRLDSKSNTNLIIKARLVRSPTRWTSPEWVPFTPRLYRLPTEELRLDTLKLAGPTVICENASGKRRAIDLRTLRILKTAGAVARMIQRKKDKAITRVFLLAEPNEIATRITAQATVVKVLPSTYTHRSSLMAGL